MHTSAVIIYHRQLALLAGRKLYLLIDHGSRGFRTVVLDSDVGPDPLGFTAGISQEKAVLIPWFGSWGGRLPLDRQPGTRLRRSRSQEAEGHSQHGHDDHCHDSTQQNPPPEPHEGP